MQKLLEEKNITYKSAVGEAAFYGPKIDIMAIDAIGREWQISTIQLDFNMPGRFELIYTDSDGKQKNPVMIHRALIGSPDRFLGILTEHYAGAFPTWLSPVQVAIVPVNENHEAAARDLEMKLKEKMIRTELLTSDASLGKRINGAKAQKVPYVIVLGDKEIASGNLTVETRAEKLADISIDQFIERLLGEIKNRTL